jgi:hypothetical protein
MDAILRTGAESLDATLAYTRFWLAMAFTALWTVAMFTMTPIETRGADRDELLRRTRLAVIDQHRIAGAAPSPLEPMVAPPGRRSGER